MDVTMIGGSPRSIRRDEQIRKFRQALQEASRRTTYSQASAAAITSYPAQPPSYTAELTNRALRTVVTTVKSRRELSTAAIAVAICLAAFIAAHATGACWSMLLSTETALQRAPLDGGTKMLLEIGVGLLALVAGTGTGLAAYRVLSRPLTANVQLTTAVAGAFAVAYAAAQLGIANGVL